MRTLALALAVSLFTAHAALSGDATAGANAKLNAIILPKIDFRDATLPEALEFVAARAGALDSAKEGVNIILKRPVAKASAPAAPAATAPPAIPGLEAPGAAPAPPGPATTGPKVTLTLNNIPLGEVLKYLTNLTDSRLRIDPHAVVVIPPVDGKKLEERPRPEVPIADGVNMDQIVKPLQQTKIPLVELRDATVTQAFDYFTQQAKALLPGGKTINIVLKNPEAKDRLVTFKARQLPLIDALRYTAELADLEIAIEPFAIVVSDPKAK